MTSDDDVAPVSRPRFDSSAPLEAGAAAVLDGIAGSPGLAIGRAVVLDRSGVQVPRRSVPPADVENEVERFRAAVERAVEGLRDVSSQLSGKVGAAESSILEAYVMMVQDQVLREKVEHRIRGEFKGAQWALGVTIGELADQLRAAPDPYLQERSRDFEFVGERLQQALVSEDAPKTPLLEHPCVIVAHDLSPAETAALDRDKVLALVTEVGTRTSHTAILARALEIPAVVGVRDLLREVEHHDLLIVDGSRGRVTLSPSQDAIQTALGRAQKQLALARDLREDHAKPALTACGQRVHIRANIELPEEAKIAAAEGAEGVGLYRTEFLFVDRRDAPSEDEQYEVYREVMLAVGERPVTLRTFDLGGDKFPSATQWPVEANPALGMRAVRLSLTFQDMFLSQLRAMIRASAHGELRIMVPMVSRIEELEQVKQLHARALAEVDAAGQERAEHIPLGVMIEVPAAALMADVFAEAAEFLCVGTNDLVQYTLAADRSSRELAQIASPFSPAILRLVQTTVQAAERWQRPLSVCGAMASDPFAVLLLLGLGVRDISMEAAAIGEIKAVVSRVTANEVRDAAAQALHERSAADVELGLVAAYGERFIDLLVVE